MLQVLPSLVTGGVERGTVEITQAIAEARGGRWWPAPADALVAAVERAGGRHVTLPLDSRNPLAIWRNAARLAALIRAERVEIVHARSRAPAWSAWLACRRTGAHFVTTYHGTYGEDLPFKRRYNAVMAQRRAGDRRQPLHRRPRSWRGTAPTGAHPGHPPRCRSGACSIRPQCRGDRMARLAQAWRLPDGAPIVLLPGRLTGWKGQAVLIEALARMRAPRRVRRAGRIGPGAPALCRAADRARPNALGVADRLRLAGDCDDMPAALMLADVVVHASTEPEAFGRVVIEAQAMARPVIASDLGGPAETVEHGVTGWRVPPGDAAAPGGGDRACAGAARRPSARRWATARARRCCAATPWPRCRRRRWRCMRNC